MVIVAVHFVEVYASRQVQCGAGVALAALPTPHDCQAAVMEALENATVDHERWKSERFALAAIAANKAKAKRKSLVRRNGHVLGDPALYPDPQPQTRI